MPEIHHHLLSQASSTGNQLPSPQWPPVSSCLVKKAQQRLFFLSKLSSLPPQLLRKLPQKQMYPSSGLYSVFLRKLHSRKREGRKEGSVLGGDVSTKDHGSCTSPPGRCLWGACAKEDMVFCLSPYRQRKDHLEHQRRTHTHTDQLLTGNTAQSHTKTCNINTPYVQYWTEPHVRCCCCLSYLFMLTYVDEVRISSMNKHNFVVVIWWQTNFLMA